MPSLHGVVELGWAQLEQIDKKLERGSLLTLTEIREVRAKILTTLEIFYEISTWRSGEKWENEDCDKLVDELNKRWRAADNLEEPGSGDDERNYERPGDY